MDDKPIIAVALLSKGVPSLLFTFLSISDSSPCLQQLNRDSLSTRRIHGPLQSVRNVAPGTSRCVAFLQDARVADTYRATAAYKRRGSGNKCMDID